VLKDRWKRFVGALSALKVDLVLIAHEREKDKNGETVLRPDIQGGTLSEVLKDADAVGYISTTNNRLTLNFTPTDEREGKNPPRWSPFPIPDPAKEPLFLHDILEQLKDHINKQAQTNAEAAGAAAEWRGRVGLITDVDALNLLLPEVNKLKNPLRAQVAALVNEHAKEKGWTFDKKAKTFAVEEAAFA